jgi:predicted enzyme related to lactoylglutathione lyase
MKMNPVIHFEMPAEDKKRVAAFYTKVFGWTMQHLGEDMGNYVLATTTESDESGPKKPGAINGGFFLKDPSNKDQYPSVVIAVPDIKTHMKKVTEAGGTLISDIMPIPGIGMYVSFKDSEGNRVGMLQPSR